MSLYGENTRTNSLPDEKNVIASDYTVLIPQINMVYSRKDLRIGS